MFKEEIPDEDITIPEETAEELAQVTEEFDHLQDATEEIKAKVQMIKHFKQKR